MIKINERTDGDLSPAQARQLAGFDELPNAAHVDVRVVAALNGISVPSAWRWTRQGKLPTPVRMTAGTTRWNVGALRGVK